MKQTQWSYKEINFLTKRMPLILEDNIKPFSPKWWEMKVRWSLFKFVMNTVLDPMDFTVHDHFIMV